MIKASKLDLAWQGTAKLTGSALVGYTDRSSDDGQSDQNGSIWHIDLTWMPLSYSSINFSTRKNNEESIGIAAFTGNWLLV